MIIFVLLLRLLTCCLKSLRVVMLLLRLIFLKVLIFFGFFAIGVFGFHPTFINWIHVILYYVFLSIKINGNMVDYFNYGRSVRQGDSLSPILLCLAKEMLSRGIYQLAFYHKILLMIGPKGKGFSIHVLCVNDIFVFFMTTWKSLTNLIEFFHVLWFYLKLMNEFF